jgi:hypothetical protein
MGYYPKPFCPPLFVCEPQQMPRIQRAEGQSGKPSSLDLGSFENLRGLEFDFLPNNDIPS